MQLTAAELAALDSGLVRIALFFRMDTVPPIRLWLGVGSIATAFADVVDPAGAVYLGLGELRHVPEVSQLINGQAERVEFLMSGVSGELLGLASESAEEVKGREVAIGFGLMDTEWRLIGAVRWTRLFYADFLSIDQAPSEGENPSRTLSLSCGSLMTGRRRPGLAFYSDADQQRRSPGDKFFERVPKYSQEVRKVWPRF